MILNAYRSLAVLRREKSHRGGTELTEFAQRKIKIELNQLCVNSVNSVPLR